MINCFIYTLLTYTLSETSRTLYHPIDQNHVIYESCKDALVRGGIRPNPSQSLRIILIDGTTRDCEMERLGGTSCPIGMYGQFPKCFTVHQEYVDNTEASR